jgi:hypothetical protein
VLSGWRVRTSVGTVNISIEFSCLIVKIGDRLILECKDIYLII